MGQQLVVYEKSSGVITQIMSFNSTKKLDIEALQLDKVYDVEKIGFVVEEDDIVVNLKRDRVVNGSVQQSSMSPSLSSPPLSKPDFDPFLEGEEIDANDNSSVEELFDEVEIAPSGQHRYVGLITPWNKQCGIANYSMDLVKNLDCKVKVFCEKYDQPEVDSKVEVIPCWTNRDDSYDYLVELIRRHNIDIVHIQYNHDLLNAGQLKVFGNRLKEYGIKSIMTLHSSKGGVDVFGESFDKMVVHTKVSSEDIIGESTDVEQVNIIPIGSLEPDEEVTKEEMCERMGIDSGRPIISNFGFFLPQKGVKEQIKALRIIKEKIPDVLLLVVCAIHTVQNEDVSEKYYEECKDLSVELGLEDNVNFYTEFLPYDEIFNYLKCSDLIVMPYVNSAAQATSSAGRTVLKALRPVLATDVEIFTDLEGVVPKIEPKNVGLLANGIIKILNDKTLQEKILQNIKNFIHRTSWKNVARQHMRMYKSLNDISIDIEGQVYSYFSASVVNRNLACALDDLGIKVSLRSVNMAENEDYELGDNSPKLLNNPLSNRIQVRHHYPPNFNNFTGRRKIIYLPVETSVPDEWVKSLKQCDIDYIWVYTHHGKELFAKTDIDIPVEVIRCGYDSSLFNKHVVPVDFGNIPDSYTNKRVEINDDTFIFLFVGHAQERKNFKTIFKSYLTEYTSDDNVLFVIKSYDGGEVHEVILEIFDYVRDTMGREEYDLPKFLYIYEDTDPRVLPTYYMAADVMCQCSRAEGFGKPIVEAMALGIPSIATLWSGPKDFCTEKNSFPVPYELVSSDYHVQSKTSESLWADTKVEDLRKVMRFCSDNPDEVKKRGKQALIDSEDWSMEAVVFDVVSFVRKYNLA